MPLRPTERRANRLAQAAATENARRLWLGRAGARPAAPRPDPHCLTFGATTRHRFLAHPKARGGVPI